jgi:regulator of protease activity HflC (stomatin/prohibitin superfamily)
MSTRKAVPTNVRSVLLQRELDDNYSKRIPVPTNIRSRILERGEK